MNRALIKFEVHRLLRQPYWAALLASALMPLVLGGNASFLLVSIIPLFWGLLFGSIGIWRGSNAVDTVMRENEYLLSRTGTRTEFLLARWASHLLVSALLWVTLTVVLAATGALSSHSRVNVDWQTVSVFERAGYHAVFSSPFEEERHARWVGNGQPLANVGGMAFSGGRVDVEVPFMALRVVALAFVAFLLGLVSQTVEPRRATSRWRSLREPMQYLKWGPFAVVAVLCFAWPLIFSHSLARQELMSAI